MDTMVEQTHFMLLPALPIVAPLAAAIGCLLCWRTLAAHRWLALIGALSIVVAGIALLNFTNDGSVATLQVSRWAAPFGITLAVDQFSAWLVLISGCTALSTVFYGWRSVDNSMIARGYYPLLLALVTGINGAFTTGDIFNLYVWFEVLLMSSFGLIALQGHAAQLRAGVTYVLLNLISSTCFLLALALLYAQLGSLNMAELSVLVRQLTDTQLSALVPLGMLLLCGFGIKAGLFPFFWWLPNSYPAPAPPIMAIFAALLSKVGVYALIRVFGMVLTPLLPVFAPVFLIMSVGSLICGTVGAVYARHARGALCFLIVSGVGLPTMALALGHNQDARILGGALYYTVQSALATLLIFQVTGTIRTVTGSDDLGSGHTAQTTKATQTPRGIFRTHPGLALMFLFSSLALAAIPPLPAFVGKLTLLVTISSLPSTAPFSVPLLSVVIVVVSGAIGLLGLALLWSELVWNTDDSDEQESRSKAVVRVAPHEWLAFSVPAALLLITTLYAGELIGRATEAARGIISSDRYVLSVLPGAANQETDRAPTLGSSDREKAVLDFARGGDL